MFHQIGEQSIRYFDETIYRVIDNHGSKVFICCCSSRAFSAATSAKCSVLSAKMMPRELFTSKPPSSVMPYRQTSSSEPPCAPMPGTRRKLLGATLRMSLKSSPCVAPPTYIL